MENVKSELLGSVNIINGWKESSAKLDLNVNNWVDFFKFANLGDPSVTSTNTGKTQGIVTAKNFIKPVT